MVQLEHADARQVSASLTSLFSQRYAQAQNADVAVSAQKRIRENFVISTVYNVIAVPIALVGLATPLAAALAMSASSLSVSLNAMRVKR